MKKQIAIGCLLLGLVPAAASAAGTSGEPEELFTQQLLIHELSKEVTLLEKDLKKKEKELTKTEKKWEREREALETSKEKGMAHLMDYYKGKELSWLEMLFSGEGGWMSFFTKLHLIEKEVEKREEEIAKLYASYQQAEERRQSIEKERYSIQTQRERAETHLKELAREEERYRTILNREEDVEAAKKEAEAFIAFWESEGIPLFETFFRQGAGALKNIDELVGEEAVTYHLLSPSLTLREKDLNDFLQNENPLFRESSVNFSKEGMTFHIQQGPTTLQVVGTYQVVEDYVAFSIKSLEVNSLPLPTVTIKRFENSYNLNFYPKKIHKRANIRSIRLSDDALIFTFSLW